MKPRFYLEKSRQGASEEASVREALKTFSGVISEQAAWADIPAHSDPDLMEALDKQAKAIDSRTKLLRADLHEALRRSYAEAGFQLVVGSFESGGAITTITEVLLYEANGQAYAWEGALPKVVPPASNPASTGGVVDGAWRPVGDITLREDLATIGGAELVGTSTGDTVEDRLQSVDASQQYLNNLQFSRSHKYKVMHELVHHFAGYDAVVAAGGYSYLYATGHTFDHVANELWVAYQAQGGDTAQFYVVYDLTSMAQKTYFKCGKRWTKTFNLRYVGAQRLLYARADNGFLAAFDVTVLPITGGVVTQYAQPKLNIDAGVSSIMGDKLLTHHADPTTNSNLQFNTFLVLNPDTFNHEKVFRVNTVTAGDANGTAAHYYKTQGVCFTPAGIGIARGGFVDAEDFGIKNVSTDFRIIQGVTMVSPNGVTQNAGMFDPFKAMDLMNTLGYVSDRFEHEGLNYDEKTQKLTTIWHINSLPDEKFLIVEAFSADEDALDFSGAAISLLPEIPETGSLWRDDPNGTLPHDPCTGQVMPDVNDICQFMIRYDVRSREWYTTNFSDMTYNGTIVPGSCITKLTRGTNTTFELEFRSTGTWLCWQIQIAGSVYTYTRKPILADKYMFEGTGTGDFIGNGSPEGVLSASTGSTYRNRDGGVTTTLYVKTSGTGNTGWTAK